MTLQIKARRAREMPGPRKARRAGQQPDASAGPHSAVGAGGMTRTLGLGTRVDRLLAKKGHRVVAVNTNVTICDAARTMTQNRVGSVIVRSGTCVVGLLTERDCVERVVARNLDPARTRVHEVMDPEVHAVTLNETVANCLALMTRRRSRHVTVTEGDRLMGILSIGDCVAFLCDRLREENRDLLEYITGRYPG